MDPRPPSASDLARGRLLIFLAAVLWSLSGMFTKLLTRPSALDLNDPPISNMHIACYRVFFAALVLLPNLRRGSVSFRPLMVVMALSFAAMNYLFISATSEGTAADAILLQYTAPMWMYLASVWFLGEASDRRSLIALLAGVGGIGVIIAGGVWGTSADETASGSPADRLRVFALGLGSGFTYAIVVVCLRVLRDCSSSWLTVLNLLVAGLVLLPIVLTLGGPNPSAGQWVVLFLFGAVQMGLPYLLMAHGLRTVSPQEAGTITLLEPLLSPLWAFLVVREVPSRWTFLGGAIILGALAWRYWPRKR